VLPFHQGSCLSVRQTTCERNTALSTSWPLALPPPPLPIGYIQFSTVSSVILRGDASERPAWKDESWAMLETDCDWWTGSEGEAAVSSRQLELWWRSSAYTGTGGGSMIIS